MGEQKCKTCESCQECGNHSKSSRPAKKDTGRAELTKLIVIVLLMVIALGFNSWRKNQDFISKIYPLIPQADQFELISSDPLVYKAIDGDKILGYCGVGKGTGYGGTISIAAAINPEGKVIGIKVLDQTETPSYFDKLLKSNYFKQYRGKDIKKDAFLLNRDVDVVSGATVSSRGVVNAVINSIQGIVAQQPELAGGRDWSKRTKIGHPIEEYYPLISLLVLLAIVVYASRLKKTKLRWLTMIAGIVILGIWQKRMISLTVIANFLMNPIGFFKVNLFSYVLVLAVIIFCLFMRKNLYCSWICPFGAAQEIVFKASGNKNPKINKKLSQRVGQISRILAVSALIIGILVGNPGLTSFEPFPTLFGFNGGAMQWLLLAVVLVGSFCIERFWCRFFCPVGIINTWMLKWGLKIKKISPAHKTKSNKKGTGLDAGAQ